MGDVKLFKVQPEDLTRLWHLVMNSTPHDSREILALRAAAAALGGFLKPVIQDRPYPTPAPGLELPVNGEYSFDEAARSGMAVALAQSITGENHPQAKPAPFGSIEYTLLPIAVELEIVNDVWDLVNKLREGP